MALAYAYADAHRLIRYRGGAALDITAYAGDMTATDALEALAVELTFTVIRAPWDKYIRRDVVQPGDKLRVVNHEKTVFSGQVVTVGLDGAVTAYDRGWFLNKSQIILQCTAMAADAAIRQACSKAGVGVASICPMPTKVTQVWLGSTPADIFHDIIELCTAETGKAYQFYAREGGLTVRELPTAVTRAYHRPAANVAAFDITWALGQVSGEDSIAEMYNSVLIAAEADGKAYVGARASNAESIRQYGFQQHVETVTSNPGTAALGQMARSLLAQNDRIGRTRTIAEIWGCDEVTSGTVLLFNSPAFGIEGRCRVTQVVHHYGGAGHTMELEIAALDEPRAMPQTQDTVIVHGLPDNIGSGGAGVATGGGGNASAFLSVAASQIGYREGAGNRNKYGAWAGNDGVAWCVYFVCWCAAQSSAPIPTGYGFVGDMSSYFQSRGQFRSASSGYIPKPGDLMIQGTRHIGIVRSASRSGVQTIEGNYSNGVAAVSRSYSEITGFCTPWG